MDPLAVLFAMCWVLFFPALWVMARFYPRVPGRVLFWTNQGFCVAPSRARSYFVCREMQRLGVDAEVLSFWEHLLGYKGLLPLNITLGQRTILIFRAMLAAVHSRAETIVAQAPLYDIISLVYLRFLYPRALRIWIDLDDWLFDVSMDGSGSTVTLRDTLPLQKIAATGVIVSSLPLETEMRKHFRRVEIMPTYPDAAMFRPDADAAMGRPDEKVIFSWTGTFLMKHVVSDIVFLARALNSLKSDKVIFHVVGDGHHIEEAREQVALVADRVDVRFLGWMDPERMPEYLNSIDVGLYCLRTIDNFAASKSPTKLFEYMACAKPTVSTNFGEARRFIDHGVTGFLAADLTEFAGCCSQLATDPKLRAAMGKNARKAIEQQHNISAGAERLKSILRL
ncbi:glycosyltransferase [Thermodesulfobacteriota bacterium]